MALNDDDIVKGLEQKDQRKVAIALSDILIEQVPAAIQESLKKIRDIVWENGKLPEATNKGSYEADSKRREADIERIKGIFAGVTDEGSKELLVQAYARLGHLYEIAGHAARENFFLDRDEATGKALKAGESPTRDQMVPGGINELLFNKEKGFSGLGVDEVISRLNTPVSEYVFTQHPTNTNQLESLQLQRAIAKDVDNIVISQRKAPAKVGEKFESLKKHIAEFLEKPLVSERNFTAKDETDMCVNFLANAYHDMDRLYEVVDRGLSRKFKADYTEEKKLDLDLKTKFGSWGSAGDKDGNNNIKSENTLEAIILHKQKAAELLANSLKKIETLPDGLADWKARLETAAVGYGNLINRIDHIRKGGNDIPLSNNDFSDIVKQATHISANVGKVDDLQAQLEDAYLNTAHPEQKNQLLALNRKLKVFGFNLGKIEYRETAEEYAHVANVLMNTTNARLAFGQDAEDFIRSNDQEQRADILKTILSDKEKRKEWNAIAHEFMSSHDGSQNALRKYVKQDKDSLAECDKYLTGDEAIVYHTLRRMELARDFDDMITHNVLAEAQGVGSMMEALAMQFAVTKDNKRALLNIVPLFEEAETMAEIPNVIRDSLANDAYLEHVKKLQEREHTPDITQQVQIAHSDNARRAGAIASRGIIHDGHVEANAAKDAYNLEVEQFNKAHPDRKKDKLNLQFYEGGSLSDSYRNGVRAATAMVEDFGMKDFAKFTFQGGDLNNYFNQPNSMERLLLRTIIKQAEMNNPVNGNGKHTNGNEKAVMKGLKKLQKQYDTIVYGDEAPGNPIGRLLYELGYRDHIAAGNAGTRGGSRTVNEKEELLREIDAENIRTIGFSEALQHENIHPTFMGAGKIRQAIQDELGKGALSAADWKALYIESPSFKDAIDKLSYSIINSDLKAAGEKIFWKIATDETLQTPEWNEKNKALLNFVCKELPEQYIETSKLVYEAMTGLPFTGLNKPEHIELEMYQTGQEGGDGHMLDAADRMRHLISGLTEMEHFKATYTKHRYVDGLRVMEDNMKKTFDAALDQASEAFKIVKSVFARLFHNARDTLYYGRTFMGDDPAYKKALEQNNDKPVGSALAI